VDRTGDSGRLDFRVLGDRALIHLVDGAVPEYEPAQDALEWFRKDVDDEDLAEKRRSRASTSPRLARSTRAGSAARAST
jgi:hypothetical protein